MVDSIEQRLRGWVRALGLVEGAERASITPIPAQRLHALAYLADVLSPVWGLQPFDSFALKTEQTPFFFDVQESLDDLVIMGMLEVRDFEYQLERPDQGRLFARYNLKFDSPMAERIVSFLSEEEIWGPEITYLTALATALSRLPDDQISYAARWDASWENPNVATGDVVELRSLVGSPLQTLTSEIVSIFDELKHEKATLSPAGRLRLYATYLGERMKAA